jgi:hypothetical protein
MGAATNSLQIAGACGANRSWTVSRNGSVNDPAGQVLGSKVPKLVDSTAPATDIIGYRFRQRLDRSSASAPGAVSWHSGLVAVAGWRFPMRPTQPVRS